MTELLPTDLIDDLDADKFAIFTGRENTGFVPMTPPSSKNKSDQSNSASKSASKGSARKVKYVQSRYMQPTPTRSAEKKREVKSTTTVKSTITTAQPPSATKRRLDYGQSLTARARTSLASRASITSQSAEFPSKTASRDSTASVTATPVNEAPARTSLQRIDNTASINRTQLRASTSTVTKPVTSTTRVSGTLTRSTTAPINRAVPRPSAPSTTTARVSSNDSKKSEVNTPVLSSVTASDRSDTALLSTALLQWCFVNAKLTHALTARQHRAEQLIHTAHERLSELKTAVSRDRSDLELKQEIYLLEELLNAQISALVEHVDSCASDSLTRYEDLSTVLQYNTHRMPVSHVTLDESVLHSLNECGADLEHVIGDSSAQLDKWSEVSAMLSNLSSVVHEEVTAVKQCEQLLGALSVVQELELSLHTHRLHLHEH